MCCLLVKLLLHFNGKRCVGHAYVLHAHLMSCCVVLTCKYSGRMRFQLVPVNNYSRIEIPAEGQLKHAQTTFYHSVYEKVKT